MKILLVDDDRELVDLLHFALHRAQYDVAVAYDLGNARRQLEATKPDLIVLDINLGASSGLDLLREIRRDSRVPVLLLTAMITENDKVSGLDLGADDYITKPFSHRELLARIRARLRGQPETPSGTDTALQVGRLQLNSATHTATKDGLPLDLTVMEFRLLHYLMRQTGGAVVPWRTMLQEVWGYQPNERSVARVAVQRLRRKIEDDPLHPALLITVPGIGIRLTAEEN